MICFQISDKDEAQMYKHFKTSLTIKHSPPFYVAMAKAFIKAYELKRNLELPIINEIKD